MKFIFSLLTLLVLAGCGPKVDDEKVIAGDFYIYTSSCLVYTVADEKAFCVEYFNEFFLDGEDDCLNKQSIYGGSGYSIGGMSFNEGEDAPACSTNNTSGKCTLEDDYHIFFYNTEFSAAEAQNECDLLGGTFE